MLHVDAGNSHDKVLSLTGGDVISTMTLPPLMQQTAPEPVHIRLLELPMCWRPTLTAQRQSSISEVLSEADVESHV